LSSDVFAERDIKITYGWRVPLPARDGTIHYDMVYDNRTPADDHETVAQACEYRNDIQDSMDENETANWVLMKFTVALMKEL